jgi:hypothetical protein
MKVKELINEGNGFDTKMRSSIESAIVSLKSLAKKEGDAARKSEQADLDGLIRMQERDPLKFLYSFLEIVGARGKYSSPINGAGK